MMDSISIETKKKLCNFFTEYIDLAKGYSWDNEKQIDLLIAYSIRELINQKIFTYKELRNELLKAENVLIGEQQLHQYYDIAKWCEKNRR